MLTNFTGATPGSVTHNYYSGQQVIETRDGTPDAFAASLPVHYQYIWSARGNNSLILRDNFTQTPGTTAARLYYLNNANFNVTAAGRQRQRCLATGRAIRLQPLWQRHGLQSDLGDRPHQRQPLPQHDPVRRLRTRPVDRALPDGRPLLQLRHRPLHQSRPAGIPRPPDQSLCVLRRQSAELHRPDGAHLVQAVDVGAEHGGHRWKPANRRAVADRRDVVRGGPTARRDENTLPVGSRVVNDPDGGYHIQYPDGHVSHAGRPDNCAAGFRTLFLYYATHPTVATTICYIVGDLGISVVTVGYPLPVIPVPGIWDVPPGGRIPGGWYAPLPPPGVLAGAGLPAGVLPYRPGGSHSGYSGFYWTGPAGLPSPAPLFANPAAFSAWALASIAAEIADINAFLAWLRAYLAAPKPPTGYFGTPGASAEGG